MVVKGILRSFDAATYTATIEVVGSTPVWLAGIPVARNIPAAEMVAGRYVAVQVYRSGHNPGDAVVTAVHT